jgi:hypothetical protein
MPDNDTATQALSRYNWITRELTGNYMERGDLIAEGVSAKVQAYQQVVSEGGNVSTARHAADLAAEHHDREIAKLSGEIDSLLIELRYLDQLLAYVNGATR